MALVQVYGLDEGSGVQSVFYRLDGGSFTEYAGPITVDDVGSHTIEFYAVDHLGNEGEIGSQSFRISPVNFEMFLDQPENKLYVFGVELFGLGSPIIIGPVDVMVTLDVFTAGPANVDYVEFFVDDESRNVDDNAPFEWRLDQSLFGTHNIRVDVVVGDEVVSENVDALCIIP